MLGQRPDLTLVKLANGAKDNWSYLGTALPQGPEIIDFYHACEHLKAAFDAACSRTSSAAEASHAPRSLRSKATIPATGSAPHADRPITTPGPSREASSVAQGH